MAKFLKTRIIKRLDDTIAYFDRLPEQSGIAAGYNKRGVRYFTTVEGIVSVHGAIDSVKEGRRARKRIIVRPSRFHKGVHELYTYHFPKAWSQACLDNRETIKLAQRLAHDLEHDPVAARPMRLKYLMQFYVPAIPAEDGSTPKIYEHFYTFAYVTILRALYAAQAAAKSAADAAKNSAEATDNSADEPAEELSPSISPESHSGAPQPLSIAPASNAGITLCVPPSSPRARSISCAFSRFYRPRAA